VVSASVPPVRAYPAATSGIQGPYRRARFEQELRNEVGLSIQSPDEELAFYDLAGYRTRLEQRTSPDQWEARRDAALHPPLAVWREGFSDQEDSPNLFWRWAGSDARMTLINRAAREQHVRIEMSVTPNEHGSVIIQSPLLGEPVRVERNRPHVERILRLPPGQHDIRFVSDAPRAHPPNDFRELVFGVQNFRLTPAQPPFATSMQSARGTHE